MKNFLLVMCLWSESHDIVGCSLYHPTSGVMAYVEGHDELTALAAILQLKLHR